MNTMVAFLFALGLAGVTDADRHPADQTEQDTLGSHPAVYYMEDEGTEVIKARHPRPNTEEMRRRIQMTNALFRQLRAGDKTRHQHS